MMSCNGLQCKRILASERFLTKQAPSWMAWGEIKVLPWELVLAANLPDRELIPLIPIKFVMRIDVICCEPYTISLRPFQFHFQQRTELFLLKSYKKEQISSLKAANFEFTSCKLSRNVYKQTLENAQNELEIIFKTTLKG